MGTDYITILHSIIYVTHCLDVTAAHDAYDVPLSIHESKR
jgi:hypothetical protein